MIRIASVEPLERLQVRLRLTDGAVVERDLSELLVEPLYGTIKRDASLFRMVHVVDGTLSWPNGLDLDPDMVIWGGPAPADEKLRTG